MESLCSSVMTKEQPQMRALVQLSVPSVDTHSTFAFFSSAASVEKQNKVVVLFVFSN